MTTRIDRRMAKLKTEGRPALVTYFMGGDPDYATSLSIMKALPKAGTGTPTAGGRGPGGRSRQVRAARSGDEVGGVEGHVQLGAVDLGGSGLAAGGVSIASLLAVVRRYAAGIQFCYENELKRQPGLRGKVVFNLTVDAAGRVTDVGVVEDTLGAGSVAACALAQIRDWRFPAVAAGVTTFRAPFVFTPPQ